MNLPFLSREATDRLIRNISVNLERYRNGQTNELINEVDSRASRIDLADPPLLTAADGKASEDFNAARRIFQWLGELTPVQASDERLWVYLTHRVYPEYVHARWGSALEGSTQPTARVEDRWFFRGEGVATFVRNALSRLWWFGYLTYDRGLGDHFEFTEILLGLQEIQVAMLERRFGRSRNVLRAILEVLKRSNRLDEVPHRGDVIQGWAKDINTYGGAFVLDALPPDRLLFVFQRLLKERITA
jgi:hypothetical protein